MVETEGDRRLDVPDLGARRQGRVRQGGAGGGARRPGRPRRALGQGPARGHRRRAWSLAAVPERGDARDALVGVDAGRRCPRGDRGHRLAAPAGAAGRARGPTSASPGCGATWRTRLAKAAEFDAIVVAAVAFERLGLGDRLAEVLVADVMVPQVGQGALAVECRAGDDATRRLLAAIEHGTEPPAGRRRAGLPGRAGRRLRPPGGRPRHHRRARRAAPRGVLAGDDGTVHRGHPGPRPDAPRRFDRPDRSACADRPAFSADPGRPHADQGRRGVVAADGCRHDRAGGRSCPG